MDAGWIVLIVLSYLLFMAVLLLGFRSVSERTVPTPTPEAREPSVLEARLLTALERSHRAEVENLLAVAGLTPNPEAAADNQRALLEELRVQLGGQPDVVHVQQPPVERRGVWDFPVDPDHLGGVEFDDPTDLTQPLDAIPPQGEQGWTPDEPVAFPEPVPEAESRQRIAGISPGENPFSDLGITPAWHDEIGA